MCWEGKDVIKTGREMVDEVRAVYAAGARLERSHRPRHAASGPPRLGQPFSGRIAPRSIALLISPAGQIVSRVSMTKSGRFNTCLLTSRARGETGQPSTARLSKRSALHGTVVERLSVCHVAGCLASHPRAGVGGWFRPNHPMLLLLPLVHASAGSVTGAAARQPSAVVIGGGWAGFGAAWGLAQRGVAVTVLEASSDAVGGLAAGWRGPDGLPVELGIHGFWRSYSNCFRLCEQIGLSEDEVFTQWATPALYTRDGLSVAAPIFGDLPRLPTPLGSAVFPKFERLSVRRCPPAQYPQPPLRSCATLPCVLVLLCVWRSLLTARQPSGCCTSLSTLMAARRRGSGTTA